MLYQQKLTNQVLGMLDGNEDEQNIRKEIYEIVEQSPESPERDGLLAFIYHDGIGVEKNLDRCFEYAEKAAFDGGDGLGYYILGNMCENAETPDQEYGGPRQKYDHYDAERFYEICARIDSVWKESAILWLGEYYMDSARGGDFEIGIEYLESIAATNAEAAGLLSDWYWDIVMPDLIEDDDTLIRLYKWTRVAAQLDPGLYACRLGCLYADGIGCSKDDDRAMELFEEAYQSGDWGGARSIANMLELSLEKASDSDQSKLRDKIAYWNDIADKMYEEYLALNPEEMDNSIEED